ncbi:MAG: flagellar export chaperone FliS [Rubrivivax sp.]|nr:flagellar export chaperone FliS [Rubrivivax sp.]
MLLFAAPAPAAAARRVNPYQRAAAEIGVAAADPHALVGMLFDGFAAAVAEARGAMRRHDVNAKCAAIGRALRIVDEGLRAALDVKAGGTLARDLSGLYAYVAKRLTDANLRNDEAALEECLRLMQPIHEAWSAIAPRPAAAHAG